MKRIKKYQQGVTILEILLVLAVGVSIIMMSIRQYETWNLDKNIQALQSNVNTILGGMSNYYYVNCNGRFNPTTGVTSYGTLNPDNPSPNYFYQIDINSALVVPGFLSTNNPTIVPFNPLVRAAGTPPSGYIAQFNRYDQWRFVCITGVGAVKGVNDPACTNTTITGLTNFWTAQVAVQLNSNIPPAQYDTYKNLTGADCLSSTFGSMVWPCNYGAPGDYLVWERLPSMVTTQAQAVSPLWGNNPNLQQFNQLFTQYSSMVTIQGSEPSTVPVNGGFHYYTCGG